MKHIYRNAPCDIYDVTAMESWLSDMAARGYIFDKVSRFMFRFIKAAPADIRFLILTLI